MIPFSGFSPGKTRLTPVPEAFFRELLPQINNFAELKITLYVFWFLNQQQGETRYITRDDFLQDQRFMHGLADDPVIAAAELDQGINSTVERGTLLKSAPRNSSDENSSFYFLNSANGRAALKALENGKWIPDPNTHLIPALDQERPTIYKLYEENIGPLTPLIADTLRDAELTYSPEWIQDAIQIAVESNVRRWRYVEAILKSWQENGRHGTDRQDLEKNRDYYLKGDSAGIIER